MKLLQGKSVCIALGGRLVLNQIDFEIRAGEMLGLIGPNGAGKTTLLRLLAGLLSPDTGRLMLDGIAYSKLSPEARARKIAYLAQHGTAHWPMSVERIVALGRLPHLSSWQGPDRRDDKIIQQVMKQTDIAHLQQRSFSALSGGEQARVLLARALAAEPEILLVDEPVAALDPAHQLEVMSLLRSYCDQGGAVVVILHDLQLASHFCHRLQLLFNQTTLATGPVEEVLAPAYIEAAFGITIIPGSEQAADAFSLTWKRLPSEEC